MTNQLILLEKNFEKMEECGKVDPYLDESLRGIDSIIIKLKSIKDKERSSENPLEAFHYYHLSSVSMLILESIKNRLKKAKINKDNPKIALDGLAIIPSLQLATNKLHLSKSDESFLEIASSLQESASRYNLFNMDKLIKKIDSAAIEDFAREISLS